MYAKKKKNCVCVANEAEKIFKMIFTQKQNQKSFFSPEFYSLLF